MDPEALLKKYYIPNIFKANMLAIEYDIDECCIAADEPSYKYLLNNKNKNNQISEKITHFYTYKFDLLGSVSKFPDNLEYLEIVTEIDKFTEYANDNIVLPPLPKTLKHIKICITGETGYSDFDINSDYVRKITDKLIGFLHPVAETLESLCVNWNILDFTPFKNLKTFILNNSDIYIKDLDNLPNTLEILIIQSVEFNSPLNNLPPSLKYLSMSQSYTTYYTNGYSHKLEQLPASLEVLIYPDIIGVSGEDFGITFDNLPPNLKYLSLPALHTRCLDRTLSFDNLPDSIEVIDCRGKHIDNCNIEFTRKPKNLKVIGDDLLGQLSSMCKFPDVTFIQ